MGPYWSFQVLIEPLNPYTSLWVLLGPILISSCGSLRVLIGPYVSLFVLIFPDGFLLVLIYFYSLYAFWGFPMGPYWSLFVLMGAYTSLCVLIGPSVSLWVLIL